MNDCAIAPWDNPDAVPLVQIRGLLKRFGDFTALDHIDLDVYPQEFFALLGPSGCGKTTIMRMLAGFETPTAGKLMLEGQDLAEIPPYRRNVNMMFQSYALFPHMSVADNVAFGLKQDKRPKDEIAARVEEMLGLVQLGKFANRKPHQLSGGQRQRVALARALAKKPPLLLLDEPLGALDKKLRQETQFELVDIQEKLGLTFMIVTHDQEEAMTMATRIAVMNEGKIVQVATPNSIYETPNSVYVANFLGEINLIAGNLHHLDHGGTELHWAEGKTALRVDHAFQGENGLHGTLALRPERVSISHHEPQDGLCRVQGVINDIAYRGNLSLYYVKLANGMILKAQEANSDHLEQNQYTWEDKVWLSWRPSAGSLLLK